jgi:hypothetical protein
MRAPAKPAHPSHAGTTKPAHATATTKPCLASAESAKTAAARISAAQIDTLFNIGILLMTEILSGHLTPMTPHWSQ